MKWIKLYTSSEGDEIYGKVWPDGKMYQTANPGYKELDAYLEWVEAGNTPEDFWTQDDEMIEPSEPKEEEETTEGES